MLYDFMLLLEKGAFYLAGERMKAPQFFKSIRGKSEVFNEGCRRMGEVLSNRSCKSGDTISPGCIAIKASSWGALLDKAWTKGSFHLLLSASLKMPAT